MALTSGPTGATIDDGNLQSWTVIDSGGFGRIYKARHLQWCCDVAIKMLYHDDGFSSSLLHEITMMQQARNPCVIQVLGVYTGKLLNRGASTRLGLVMEFMEKGSLASLQAALRGPPPWALAFRLAHQVALGINFLHSQSPAVLHLDLKPSNVLLDSSLNAKLTDFGLSRFYQSVTRGSKKDTDKEGGTISYMPPEAFDLSYKPTKASDIYSYGILLWSIVAGKQPYEYALSTLVRVCIPRGERPLLEDIKGEAAGLDALVELMKRCWVTTATERPHSFECTFETEKLYQLHKASISHAVHEVLVKLDQKEEERRMTYGVTEVPVSLAHGSSKPLHRSSLLYPKPASGVSAARHLTGPPPVQEMSRGFSEHQRDKRDGLSMKGQPRAGAANACLGHGHSSSEAKLEVTKTKDIKAKASPLPNPLPQYQRQFSSPENVQPYPRQPPLYISLSNAIGVQYGNNNRMHIDRRRHPTAPSSVNRSGIVKDEAGRFG